MNTTPLMKGGFMLLVHPKDPKVLLIDPRLYQRIVTNDASFHDNRQWFRSLRRLFPQDRMQVLSYRAGGRVRSPAYVAQLRRMGRNRR